MEKSRLFVGGLPWAVDDAVLKALFEEGDDDSGTQGCGPDTVREARVVPDRETNRSRGFGFVEMASVEDAKEAIKKFNGLEYRGRTLKVDIAADQATRRGNNDSSRRGSNEGSFRSARGNSGFSDYPFKKKKEY